ncbi:DUF86 domain-containing protein [Plectonema cf. radiosum LEGE 06105]|uniref:DUF86 domain-containing protein n=1 Tax=Plectonema cf. radiosum LEGE 06105 TaxID=945769 RepID=A0A8J7K0Z0_9CYAN|nr:DUF86 domain-containing protein [Plectonema radiosum]MBE9214246.1 DUF86 domain-containing protein [Plectonema cf. radiosum LEGE 06105]
MPSRDWRFRIGDMVQAIIAIQNRVANFSFADFQANETIAKAVFYDFLIIGEAPINIPPEVQLRYPKIPWRVIADMRNVMAHKYFQVNQRIVWNTIENNLPELMLQLEELIEKEEF